VSQVRIGVVGGGLAGIAAALSAADAGANVTLIERRPHLGGLTTSIQRDGLSFDNGQHVFLRCCSAYRALLERIGATGQVYLQPRLNVPVLSPDGSASSISRTNLPAPLHLAKSIASYRFLSLKERLRLIGPVLALRRLDPRDPALDQISFGEWLTARSQSRHAVNRLWNLIVQPTLNVSSEDASLALAVQVFRVGFLARADGADMGWSRVPLSELHGTNAQRALDAAGVTTLLNTSVTSITHSSADSVAIDTPNGPVAVDAVIVATPPRMSASLGALSDAQLANDLATSPIVNIHFVFDRKVTDYSLAAGIDSPIEFVFDRTDASGVTSGQCLVISLSAADRYIGTGSTELVENFHQALCDLFPRAREANVVSSVVTREHAATFRAVPGVEARRASASSTDPRIFLAGAWCDTGWPATMEGAVRSGNDAASRALSLDSASTGKGPRNYEKVPS
jgi:squalene-associated FAD-dependent desaturase